MQRTQKFLLIELLLCLYAIGSSLVVLSFPLPKPGRDSVTKPSASAQIAVEVDSPNWQLTDPKARVEEHLGRKSLFIQSGFALLKGVDFENGTLEFDFVAPKVPTFIGAAFRAENSDDHEIVYFRPHKSKLPDAVQYTPSFNGGAPWQIYSGKGFTNAVEIPRGEWAHARIEIAGLGGKVFLNNSAEPVLVIEDLKRGYSHGTIGLWAIAGGGHFSNFSYRVDPVTDRPEKKPPMYDAGILTQWELSEAFEASTKNPEHLLSPADMKALKWQAVGVEVPGMVVIDRYRHSPGVVPSFGTVAERTGKGEKRRFVFARTTIYSDRDQVKRLSIGYTDEATLFLNGSPVFTGRSAYRFRDPGFLGIMDVEDDTLYLNLKKGRNELVLTVAEYFGGWGFICRLDDMQGVKLEN